MTGGGSGGHITPILAVASELKQLRPDAEIVYIGQTGDSLGDLPEKDQNIDRVVTVRAGKFRRYHGEGIKQLLDVVTLYKNLRDAVWVLVGLWQSYWLLGKLRPDIVFVKGGFVGVPVGLAAKLRGIPYVTHDSDAHPGLANRIVAPWARIHAVSLPKEVYSYPPDKTVTVGVPIRPEFHPVTEREVRELRKRLHIAPGDKVLMITGGGNGAASLNDAVADCMPELLERYPDLSVVHIAGRAQEAPVRQQYKQLLSSAQQGRVAIKGHVANLYDYSAISDVIITRAGATSLAEFAAQAKACVVVPNPMLTGGHQLKNAKVLADRKAVKLVDDERLRHDHGALMPPLVELFDEPARAAQLGARLATLAQPNAAHLLAVLLLEVVGQPPTA